MDQRLWRPLIELANVVTSEPVKDNRRLGVDAFLDGRLLEHALVANRKAIIEVSIGPEGSARKQLPEPVKLDFGDRDLYLCRYGSSMTASMRSK